jgi:hypothetical protein
MEHNVLKNSSHYGPKNMKKYSLPDKENVKEDIDHLINATSQITDDVVAVARKRLKSVIAQSGSVYDQALEQATSVVKKHTGSTLIVAILMGLAVGCFLGRKSD